MIHHRPQRFDDPLLRRSNLISRATPGGGMVLTLSLPLEQGDTTVIGSSARNASLRIDDDGRVFLTVPYLRSEGDISASIPSLIADQLEVTLNRIHLEQALPKEEFAAETISDGQLIGNLETIPAALRLLSEAGATARSMLIAAAAERWGVNARSCHAHDGEVIHTPTWRKLKYGELAVDAAYRPIPREVELKPPPVERLG
jgi:isoquinoline 1-oxidoreductase subunit beta